jgi:hypothetical protein
MSGISEFRAIQRTEIRKSGESESRRDIVMAAMRVVRRAGAAHFRTPSDQPRRRVAAAA